jgi:hypothetical protein
VKRKFELAGREFWIEIISISDLNHLWPLARPVTASTLKKLLQNSEFKKVSITPTMPDVYVVLGGLLLKIPYRPFLTFAAQLYEVEEEVHLDWRVDGF